jgi:hypothetical protein
MEMRPRLVTRYLQAAVEFRGQHRVDDALAAGFVHLPQEMRVGLLVAWLGKEAEAELRPKDGVGADGWRRVSREHVRDYLASGGTGG